MDHKQAPETARAERTVKSAQHRQETNTGQHVNEQDRQPRSRRPTEPKGYCTAAAHTGARKPRAARQPHPDVLRDDVSETSEYKSENLPPPSITGLSEAGPSLPSFKIRGRSGNRA